MRIVRSINGSLRRLFALVALVALAACGRPGALAPVGVPDAAPLGLQPANGLSALPGANLPCGLPAHATRRRHDAACPVAINVHFPGLRNPHVPASKIPGLHPDEIVQAYGFPSGIAHPTVAVVDAYDDPRAEADLNVYRKKFALGTCTVANGCFEKVNQLGATRRFPHASKAWSQEIALDLEMVSAVCPHCRILLVEANSASIDDLGAGVDEAVALGAKVVSNSYYATEWSGEASEDAHYDHPGVAITASSGDLPNAYYPAASPYVTAVGGTSLTRRGGAWSEAAWKYGGRGCSAFEPLPAFQPALCATRSAVDMAVVGNPQTGVSMFASQAGGWVVAGGTSVGAPIVAAAYALSGNPTGPAFSYQHPADFHDVPPAGFDLATGLGSPSGVAGL